jgi:OmpA-OmpF porin, OOP family
MKNRTTVAVLSLASGLAFSAPAVAQDSGFYVGGALGQSKVDLDCTGAATCDDKDTSWKIFGGYQFNRNFALEFGYVDLGEAALSGPTPPFGTTSAKLESTAFELVGVGMLPIVNRFSIYGKLGLYRADTDAQATATALGSAKESDSNTDLTFGVGVRYDFTRNLGIRAEWQRYADVSAGAFGEGDIDVTSVGLLWRF